MVVQFSHFRRGGMGICWSDAERHPVERERVRLEAKGFATGMYKVMWVDWEDQHTVICFVALDVEEGV